MFLNRYMPCLVLFLGAVCMETAAQSRRPYVVSGSPIQAPSVKRSEVFTTTSSTPPFRLTTEVLKERRRGEIESLDLMKLGPWDAGVYFETQDLAEGLEIYSNWHPPGVSWSGLFSLKQYNALRISMRTTDGKSGFVEWMPVETGRRTKNERKEFNIIGDGEFHEYTVPLEASNGASSSIKEMYLRFISTAGTVTLRAVELINVPPEAPTRLRQNAQMLEVLPNPMPQWRVRVPESARFEAYLTLNSGYSSQSSNEPWKIAFVVDPDGGEPVRIDAGEFSVLQLANFTPVTLDLSPWSGQEVVIRARGLGPSHPLALLWGNPMILAPRKHRTPIFLISIDTLRADHLSSYGYPRKTSPNLDRFAKEDAVLFSRAFCQETYTLSSHMTMLTGLYPKNHGVTRSRPLAEPVQTLPDLLRDHAYQSAAFTGIGGWLAPEYGFMQGMDYYDLPGPAPESTQRRVRRRAISTTLESLTKWLDTHDDVNPFVFFHNFDVHSNFFIHQTKKGNRRALVAGELPYSARDSKFDMFSRKLKKGPNLSEIYNLTEGDEPWSMPELSELDAADWSYLKALYDDSILMVDHHIGLFFEMLKKKKMYRDALIIVVADHGESLGEHGSLGHSTVYEQCAQVPLIVKFPNNRYAGQQSDALVQLTDILPTVLESIGAPAIEGIDGQSLFSVMNGAPSTHEYVYTRRLSFEGVRDAAWKLITDSESQKRQLYHLTPDPAETINRYGQQKPAEERLSRVHEDFYRLLPGGWHIHWFQKTGSGPSKASIQVKVEQPFEYVRLRRADAFELTNSALIDKNSVKLNLEDVKREEVVFIPNALDGIFLLELTSERPIEVITASGRESYDGQKQLVVDPAAGNFVPDSDMLRASSKADRLVVWRDNSAGTFGRERELSDEQLEELRSIGYADVE